MVNNNKFAAGSLVVSGAKGGAGGWNGLNTGGYWTWFVLVWSVMFTMATVRFLMVALASFETFGVRACVDVVLSVVPLALLYQLSGMVIAATTVERLRRDGKGTTAFEVAFLLLSLAVAFCCGYETSVKYLTACVARRVGVYQFSPILITQFVCFVIYSFFGSQIVYVFGGVVDVVLAALYYTLLVSCFAELADRRSEYHKLVVELKAKRAEYFKAAAPGIGFVDSGRVEDLGVLASAFVGSSMAKTLSPESLTLVFSKNRTLEETRRYKVLKVMGDHVWAGTVLRNRPPGSTAEHLSASLQKYASSSVYSATWLKPRMSKLGGSCGNYSNHSLMDKFEAMVMLVVESVGTEVANQLLDELLQAYEFGNRAYDL